MPPAKEPRKTWPKARRRGCRLCCAAVVVVRLLRHHNEDTHKHTKSRRLNGYKSRVTFLEGGPFSSSSFLFSSSPLLRAIQSLTNTQTLNHVRAVGRSTRPHVGAVLEHPSFSFSRVRKVIKSPFRSMRLVETFPAVYCTLHVVSMRQLPTNFSAITISACKGPQSLLACNAHPQINFLLVYAGCA